MIDGVRSAVGGGLFADPAGIITPITGSASHSVRYINRGNVGYNIQLTKCGSLFLFVQRCFFKGSNVNKSTTFKKK